VANIHRDIRTFYNVPMMMNMLVMLDDFTLENGATYLLSASHLKDEKPSEDHFYKYAERATGKKQSILLFDSLLWHAAGINHTDNPRRALTLAFTRPFQKQQLDYPRLLGYELIETLNENLKQVLGYNSRVPTNLDEWYQPPHKRFYKPGQG
jgi:ectoine hydroxylase-related dioxygenase (phytanoyl-CoA dioxygenase family)